MTITINGTGTITGITAGGLPDAIITQPDLAANVAGNGPAFSAYQSATQTLSSGTVTKILFQSEEFDTNNNFASSTFTPTVAGYYQIQGSLSIPAASNAGEIQMYVYKNGGLYKSSFNQTAVTRIAQTSCLVFCNGSTDYIEIYIYLAVGGTTSVQQAYTFFQASMVRGA
jgi:hypothetical protein